MSEFKFSCPHCDQHLAAPDDMAGTPLDCPVCHKPFVIPQPAAPAAPPPLAPPPLFAAAPQQEEPPPAPPLPGSEQARRKLIITSIIAVVVVAVLLAMGVMMGVMFYDQTEKSAETGPEGSGDAHKLPDHSAVSKAKILGTWKYSSGDMDFVITYAKNQTWSQDAFIKVNGVVLSKFTTTGEWELEGDKLISDIKTISNPNINIKQRHNEAKLIAVDATTMTTEHNGETTTMRRAQRARTTPAAEAARVETKPSPRPSATAEEYAALFKRAKEGDTQAFEKIRRAAKSGESEAQLKLGSCYTMGIGVTKDTDQAAAWFRKAADQGNASAQNNLGACYALGTGVTKDPAEAVRWWRKAAEQGDVYSLCFLGIAYANGDGVTRDIPEARKWFHKAADLGSDQAQQMLQKLGD